MLTGVLLLVTIALDRLRLRARSRPTAAAEEDVKNRQVAVLCAAILAGALIVAEHQRVAGPIAAGRRRCRGAGAGAGGRATPKRRTGDRDDAQGKGNPYFISCRAGAEEAAQELGVELIWDGPDRPRPRQAERARRELDHPRRRRDRRRGREPRRHLHGAAQGARTRHQGADLGRRRRARRARLLRQPGDARGHRQHADRRGRAPARRQGRVRHHHRRAERGEPERVDRVHQEAPGREVPEPEAGCRSGRATTIATRRSPRRRRSCGSIRT